MDIAFTIKNYRCFSDENPAKFNIGSGFTSILGINNSGKSALLKFFYEYRRLFSDLTNIKGRVGEKFNRIYFPETVIDRSSVFNNNNDRNISIDIDFDLYQIEAESGVRNFRISIIHYRKKKSYDVNLFVKLAGKLKQVDEGLIKNNVIELDNGQKYDYSLVNEIFQGLGNSIYIGPFRNAILVKSEHDYYDMKIGSDFIEEWSINKTGELKDDNQRAIDLEIDIGEIFGFRKFSIDAKHGKENLQININDKIYDLNEVGSGLSHFIIVFTNVLIKKPGFVFVDEPEMGLHPRLQMDFLAGLGNITKYGVVFATHNIGLARSVSDKIYSLRMKSPGNSIIKNLEETPRLSEFLGEISFSGYRELGFDKVLLVEGRTEIKVFMQLLRKYKIDNNIVMLPLGGADLINGKSMDELEEILRISKNIFAIIDSEKSSYHDPIPEERKEFRRVCQSIGINCHILKRRAIENYFTERAIKKVMGPKYSELTKYQKLSDIDLGWAKSDNWKIARELTLKEIEDTDLKNFLKKLK